MDIEHIRIMLKRGDVVMTRHCKERMKERNISTKQIEEALNTGRIVKEMPKSFPYPKCLIVGMTTKEVLEIPLSLPTPLFLICGVGDMVYLITADWNIPREWGQKFTFRR